MENEAKPVQIQRCRGYPRACPDQKRPRFSFGQRTPRAIKPYPPINAVKWAALPRFRLSKLTITKPVRGSKIPPPPDDGATCHLHKGNRQTSEGHIELPSSLQLSLFVLIYQRKGKVAILRNEGPSIMLFTNPYRKVGNGFARGRHLLAAPMHLNDDNLISRGLRGDQDALHVLFTRYRRLLYCQAHRLLRNHEEAEDAVQSCLLLAFRNLSTVKSQGSFRSWLVRILINEALTIIRRKKSRPAIAPDQPYSEEHGEWLEHFPAQGPDPEQACATRESAGALMNHVSRLSTPLRSTIMLCDIGERTIDEASRVLGVPRNTVKARLRRGRAKLGMAMRTSEAAAYALYHFLQQSDMH